MRTQNLRAYISPRRIGFFRFILEGYDGLAVLSTLDEKMGLVKLTFPAEVRQELSALLHDLGPQIGLLPGSTTTETP